MKQQITRLSPHQNGKVWGVMMTALSLIIIIPVALLSSVFIPSGHSMPTMMLLLLPLLYLVLGYVMTALACVAYNLVAQFTGGIEYEVRS